MERRMINGKEQNAVVIPCDEGQVFFTRRREPFLKFMMQENKRVEDDNCTHRFRLLYHNKKEADWAEEAGFKRYSNNMGKAIPWSRHTERCINYDNHEATDIYLKGALSLDDISESDTVLDAHTGNRELRCQIRNTMMDGTPFLAVGVIYLNNIEEDDIITNPITGRRNVPCVFRKLSMATRLLQTHEIVVQKADGSAITIGLFREYKEATETQKRITEAAHSMMSEEEWRTSSDASYKPENNPITPIMIDGYKL
jgi:hypothetical protein